MSVMGAKQAHCTRTLYMMGIGRPNHSHALTGWLELESSWRDKEGLQLE